MKLSVIIPVYNEENTIKDLMDKVLAVPIDKEIIIVDDHSTDKTIAVLKQLDHPSIKVIFHPTNKGKGSAIRTGLTIAKGKFIIIQDADLEYDPQDYIKIVTEAEKHLEPVVVYGSRFMGKPKFKSLAHYLGNRFLTFIANLLYGSKLTDMHTCYKLFPTEFLRSLNIESTRFEFCPEVTAKTLKRGINIVEIPIHYNARYHSEGKKITWKDGIAAIQVLFKNLRN